VAGDQLRIVQAALERAGLYAEAWMLYNSDVEIREAGGYLLATVDGEAYLVDPSGPRLVAVKRGSKTCRPFLGGLRGC
jgi:hypothetical protein